MKKLACAVAIALTALTTGAAMAKLPAPSDEAKAKAEEAKAKTAWADKVAAYKLCMSQNKVVANYRKVKAKDTSPGAVIPSCPDPGPYVAPVAPVASVAPVPTVATAAPAAPAAAGAGAAASPPAKK
jgi:hypothetical protein